MELITDAVVRSLFRGEGFDWVPVVGNTGVF